MEKKKSYSDFSNVRKKKVIKYQGEYRRKNYKQYVFMFRFKQDQKYIDYLANRDIPISDIVKKAIDREIAEQGK